MKTNRYLLPSYFKVIGWIISVPSALVLLPVAFIIPYNPPPSSFFAASMTERWWVILDIFIGEKSMATVCMILLMAGLLFIAFSKEKIEDEYITKLRGDSLIWAVIVNSVLIMVLSVTIFGGWFLFVSFFNLYTVLVLFIIKFKIELNRSKKQSLNEE